MKFTKMNGNGNDFIVIEDLQGELENNQHDIAKKLCDRHFGIGADGILYVRKSQVADTQMVIINADGSYASMCGNGIRCFAKYVWESGLVTKDEIMIETGDGVKKANLTIEGNKTVMVSINMGKPTFEPSRIPVKGSEEIISKELKVGEKSYIITTLLMGVPHTVVLGKLKDHDVAEGKEIEVNELFPQGTNVNFCEVADRQNINVRTWERGAGPTLACGTGCCACTVACNKLGLVDEKVKVMVPGGVLHIEITDHGVIMTGPAVVSFRGEVDLEK